LAKRLAELEEKIRILTAENEELRRRRQELLASQNNLSEKLSLLSAEEETLFSARDDILTQLRELQEKYDLEKMTMEEQIKLLKEQIAMSSEGSENQQIQLKNKIDEVNQDRDRLLEELRKLKEGMKKENEEIAAKNAELKKQLEREKKERDVLEAHISKTQEEQGQAVIDLHKKLGKHVRDMNVWKDFLEQDKEYDSLDLHITMAEDLEQETFDSKVDIVDGAFKEETNLLAKLHLERTGKPAFQVLAKGSASETKSTHDEAPVSPRTKAKRDKKDKGK